MGRPAVRLEESAVGRRVFTDEVGRPALRKDAQGRAPKVGAAYLELLLLPAIPALNPDVDVHPSYWHVLLGDWKPLRSELAMVFGAFGCVLSQNRENVLWACGMM
jgi:hypothetical protein